ncbi:MAG: T9SS type A sorting domain-containing protein [Aquaticitalea sp.]
MKTKLLIALFFGILSAKAQTTYHINWFTGANTSQQDKTIGPGDTVIWTWTDAAPHSVENSVGSSVETFNSGILTGSGTTYSHTFTVVGANNYFCVVHGAGSMNGTITVQTTSLGVDDKTFNSFNIVSNPAHTTLTINLPQHIQSGNFIIHDMLGKQIITKTFNENQNLQINIASLTQGIYLITLESENQFVTKRFIKN